MSKWVLSVLVLAALACHSEPPRPLTEAELRTVLTAAALDEWGLHGVDARAQTITTGSNFDGSMTIKCEYDSDKIPNAKQPLFYISSIQIFPSAIGTDDEFAKVVEAYKTGVNRVSGRSLHEDPKLLMAGDQHYSAIMRNGQNIIGNVFVVRRGRVLHTLVISRVYFDDPPGIQHLFQPMFAASDKFLAQ